MNKNQKHSIWGKWWEPFRKWIYPTWLGFEISMQFYDYTQYIHNFFEKHYDDITPYIGEIGAKTLDIFCSSATFLSCSVFLTAPACYTLYKFFKEDNLTNTKIEEKIKRIL